MAHTANITEKDNNDTIDQPITNKKTSVNLGADATLLTASKVITSLIALIMTMMLARIRSKAEMATFNQIFQVVEMLASVVMLGLPKSLNYFLSRIDTVEERRKFLSFYYTLNTILSLVVGGMLVASSYLISTYLFHNEMIMAFLYFLALFPWTKIIMSSVENLLIVSRKNKELIFFRIANSVSLLAVVCIVSYAHLNFAVYMVMYLCVEAAYTLLVYSFANKIGEGIRPYVSAKMLKTVLAFSIPLGLASVVGTFNTYIDKLIIGNLMSTEKYAEYAVAAKELPLTIISSTFSAVMIPQMARMIKKGKNNEAVNLWGQATTLSMIIITFVGVACMYFSRDVLMVMYGKQYINFDCCLVFAVYSVYLILRCTYYGMALNSMGKSKYIFWCSIWALVSNAILNVVLFFLFKLFGGEFVSPAVATIITSVIMDYLQLHRTSKEMNIKFRDVFPWKNALTIIGINAVLGGAFFGLKQVLPLENLLSFKIKNHTVDGSAFETIILCIVWALIYFAIMFKKIKKTWKNLKVKEG